MTLRLLVALERGPPSPLKIKILKIGPRHVLSWPKLSLEPKFHDPGTFFTFFALYKKE